MDSFEGRLDRGRANSTFIMVRVMDALFCVESQEILKSDCCDENNRPADDVGGMR